MARLVLRDGRVGRRGHALVAETRIGTGMLRIANDRDPKHSGPYARFGHEGMTATADPAIPKNEPGHPIRHEFTRAIPSSQCMVCHMHQPNVFVNSFYGMIMWDYESDAPAMWPKQ